MNADELERILAEETERRRKVKQECKLWNHNRGHVMLGPCDVANMVGMLLVCHVDVGFMRRCVP